MSEDVRKNLRTQGKYGDDKSYKNRDKRQKVSPPTKEPSERRFHKRNSNGNKGVNNSLTDESVSPLQYEENSNYAFSQLDDVKKPTELKGSGEFILSSTENGDSRILCEPRFLHDKEAWEYYDRLYSTTNWYSKNIVIQGVEYPQPRLVAWYGPFPYSYSGTTLEAAEMPDAVLEIKKLIEQFLASKGMNATFNSVLLNLYRNGKDSVAWHSDDELTLGISPTIASVSLGEVRKFEMRRKVKYHDDETSTDSTDEQYLVNLTHGSLIVMAGSMQDDWQHRVPKEYHDKEARINLTFRTVHPLEKVICQRYRKRKRHSNSYSSTEMPCKKLHLDGNRSHKKIQSDNSPTEIDAPDVSSDEDQAAYGSHRQSCRQKQVQRKRHSYPWTETPRKKIHFDGNRSHDRIQNDNSPAETDAPNVLSDEEKTAYGLHLQSCPRLRDVHKTYSSSSAKKHPIANIASQQSFLNEEDRIELSHFLKSDVNSMHGRSLSDYSFSLKRRVLKNVIKIRDPEKKELQFLCELTDGTHTEKNQKLITQRMQNVITKVVEKYQTSA